VDLMNQYKTLLVSSNGSETIIKFNREEDKNTLNNLMLDELHFALDEAEKRTPIIIFEGGRRYFCFGADFTEVDDVNEETADKVFSIFNKIRTSEAITISKVEGAVNAGGIGIVAASDIAIGDSNSTYSLSEILFSLIPACVYPFLVERVGSKNSKLITLMAKPIGSDRAEKMGLIDINTDDCGREVSILLKRLRLLKGTSIRALKSFHDQIVPSPSMHRDASIRQKLLCFNNSDTKIDIRRFVEHGVFPWEGVK